MLRMIDCRCPLCGVTEEYIVRVGEPLPDHCGGPMQKVWLSAPGIGYRPHYSHALGKRVNNSVEEDKALAVKGQWIASKNEVNSSYGTDIFGDNVTIQPKEQKEIRAHVEKAARMLVEANKLKSTGSGFEAVNK